MQCTNKPGLNLQAWTCHSSTHSSCHACGVRYLPSCCSPVSSGLAPSRCTSSGSVRDTPPAATTTRSGLNRWTDRTVTTLQAAIILNKYQRKIQSCKKGWFCNEDPVMWSINEVWRDTFTADVKISLCDKLLKYKHDLLHNPAPKAFLIFSKYINNKCKTTRKCNYSVDCCYYLYYLAGIQPSVKPKLNKSYFMSMRQEVAHL